ncbi:MAG: type II toxin-antitoxin system RelE/ParE family toxin [Rudaea sp.]|uniref:type II toxin-antitoxin system RelE/ParE family toxin n=1 Tax=Rudaea sp. TaxID=2136325 RepID=UPI0039E268F6
MTFQVGFTPTAEEDLRRLYEFLIDRARYVEDLEIAERALIAIEAAVDTHLAQSPMLYRKAGDGRNGLRRELPIPFGNTGYIALYEIIPPDLVLVLAVRHQLEQDYH